MALSEKRKGEIYIFTEVIFGAFLPIITVLTYAQLGSFVSLAWSTLIAAVLFAALITYRRAWGKINNFSLIKYSIGTAIFVSVLFYGFLFWGLTYTTPGNASIILLFQVFSSYLFFRWFRHELVPFSHGIGGVCMVLGALIILTPKFDGFNVGDILVLVGTLLAPLGNHFQQEARKLGSSAAVLFLRSIIAAPILFLLAAFFDAPATREDLYAALPFLLINGVLLLGFAKLLWVEGIHRISVTKAVAITSIIPLLTLLFAWIILGQVPNIWQLVSLVPLILGVLLLTDHIRLPTKKSRQ